MNIDVKYLIYDCYISKDFACLKIGTQEEKYALQVLAVK